MRAVLAASSFTALLCLAGCAPGYSGATTWLFVRIAGLGHCGDVRDIVLEVLPGGILKLNRRDQKREELGRRLDDIFRTRFYKYVFVTADPDARFRDVADVIAIAAEKVDYVAIVTPSVMTKATYREDGTCLDPNLPPDYIRRSFR
jgi:hypothetical protein